MKMPNVPHRIQDGEYNVPTLMPPEWAYGHARAVSSRDPHFRTWA